MAGVHHVAEIEVCKPQPNDRRSLLGSTVQDSGRSAFVEAGYLALLSLFRRTYNHMFSAAGFRSGFMGSKHIPSSHAV